MLHDIAGRLGTDDGTRLRGLGWDLDVRGDEVAEIRFHGVRLLRAVRPVVRDRDWNTAEGTLLRQCVRHDPMRITVETDVKFDLPGLDYEGRLELVLTPGRMEIDFTGTARTALLRNRIGLVVLHPLEVAGQPVEVLHADGSTEAGRWPVEISPHQPFTDVAGFRWQPQVAPRLRAELLLSGDVFETEDQRNWTDASFKTYGTPLALPFPVAVHEGEQVHQKAVLTAREHETPTTARGIDLLQAEPVVATRERIGLVPALVATVGEARIPGAEALLVEVLDGSELGPAAECSRADDLPLDVRLVVSAPHEVAPHLDALAGLRLRRLAVFDGASHLTTPTLWQALRSGVAERGLQVDLVVGTRAHFTELNRGREVVPGDGDGVTFSLTPQMHASELPHLMDSLQAQAVVAADAVRLAAGRPVHVGPITLRRRFNAVATSPDPATELPDPLRDHPLAAAWTVASLSRLTRPGIASVCYGDAAAGTAAALSRLAGLRGRPALRTLAPRGLAAYAVATQVGVHVWVANLGPEPRPVTVVDPTGRPRTSTVLSPWALASVPLPGT